MNQPNLVRKIYAELRSVAEADVSASELLRAASGDRDRRMDDGERSMSNPKYSAETAAQKHP